MAYGYLVTYGKNILTYKIFIVTARSVKEKKRTLLHDISPSRNIFLVQELVLGHKLAAVLSINMIKLFCVEDKHKRL